MRSTWEKPARVARSTTVAGAIAVRQRRTVGLLAVRPFENSHPLPSHPPGFPQGSQRIVGLVQHVAEKHQVE